MRAWRKFLWPLLPSPKGCHFLPPWPVACLCRIVSLCMDPSLGLYNFVCSAWKGVAKCNVLQDPYLILVTTATTSGGVLFSSRCTFLRREGEILSYFGYLVTNLRIFGALFTNLNSVAVYQNWQISGMNETKPKNGYLVLQKVSEAFKVIRLVRLPVILNLLFVRNIINISSYFLYVFSFIKNQIR